MQYCESNSQPKPGSCVPQCAPANQPVVEVHDAVSLKDCIQVFICFVKASLDLDMKLYWVGHLIVRCHRRLLLCDSRKDQPVHHGMRASQMLPLCSSHVSAAASIRSVPIGLASLLLHPMYGERSCSAAAECNVTVVGRKLLRQA